MQCMPLLLPSIAATRRATPPVHHDSLPQDSQAGRRCDNAHANKKRGRVVNTLSKLTGLKDRLLGLFVDREFFMRANGQVRFLRISALLQRRVAMGIAAIIGLWLIITLIMAINQVSVSFERMALVKRQAQIQSAEQRVSSYRGSIDDVASDLKKRQGILEDLVEQQTGMRPNDAVNASELNEQAKAAKKIGALVPEAAGLAQLEERQLRFTIGLTRLAEARTQKAAAAIRKFGLNPDDLVSPAKTGMGGLYIPFFGSDDNDVSDPRFAKLSVALTRMNAMERALSGVPTTMPAEISSLTSNYGYRADPFTGQGAMHSGIDFRGEHGAPILAAANGVVSFVGGKGGYGNTIEITHANGLVTRYAHLSRFNVILGQKVKRGLQIAAMGSTGRSTGTHLHFEVRLRDQAVNPLKFLETQPDVLKIKTATGSTGTSTTTTKG
jgi:murein DD-endopeptidase MepM/ murein hydrolase activator NlpD